ncbi:MAG: response regulator transcription factor [Promicromonosporaceae bacterium]|nr:response regulator transcription factor [Promicromonosporaceae bacterium]
MTKILVVEDEMALREPLVFSLRKEGFEVESAASGPEALSAFAAQPDLDLVLLDLMLPGLPGTEVCREIRRSSDVPIIMLTAKDSEIDKVVGLELGADDYVAKPYSFRELVARIRAVLRRRPSSPSGGEEDTTLACGPISLDSDAHAVTVAGEPVRMPLKEFELLEYLLANAGRVLTRAQLIETVWGSDYFGDTKTLDVHIKRLRAKIEPNPAEPQYLQTVRGVGYKLKAS